MIKLLKILRRQASDKELLTKGPDRVKPEETLVDLATLWGIPTRELFTLIREAPLFDRIESHEAKGSREDAKFR